MNSVIKHRSYSFYPRNSKVNGKKCSDLTQSNCKCCLTKQRTFTLSITGILKVKMTVPGERGRWSGAGSWRVPLDPSCWVGGQPPLSSPSTHKNPPISIRLCRGLHCNENPIHVFPEKELCAIDKFPGSVHIFSGSRTGRPTVGIFKSLADTWMWKLGLRPRNSFTGNISFEFSLLCLCSVGYFWNRK